MVRNYRFKNKYSPTLQTFDDFSLSALPSSSQSHWFVRIFNQNNALATVIICKTTLTSSIHDGYVRFVSFSPQNGTIYSILRCRQNNNIIIISITIAFKRALIPFRYIQVTPLFCVTKIKIRREPLRCNTSYWWFLKTVIVHTVKPKLFSSIMAPRLVRDIIHYLPLLFRTPFPHVPVYIIRIKTMASSSGGYYYTSSR